MSIMDEEREARKRTQLIPYIKKLESGEEPEFTSELIQLRNLLRKHKFLIDANLLERLDNLLKPYTKEWEEYFLDDNDKQKTKLLITQEQSR